MVSDFGVFETFVCLCVCVCVFVLFFLRGGGGVGLPVALKHLGVCMGLLGFRV